MKIIKQTSEELAAHTPGPWYTISDGIISNSVGPHWPAPQHFVADVSMLGPHAEANARLIAAAPDLLAALVECSTWMREHRRVDQKGTLLARMDAAIEKANSLRAGRDKR